VGPIWHSGHRTEPERLAACHRNALDLARQHDIDSIAFPAISCGVYGYPLEAAAVIAVREVRAWQATIAQETRVIFCCFGAEPARVYRQTAPGA
ncbi:MAG: macro domain-containing protein, partial [Rudaea sp.]